MSFSTDHPTSPLLSLYPRAKEQVRVFRRQPLSRAEDWEALLVLSVTEAQHEQKLQLCSSGGGPAPVQLCMDLDTCKALSLRSPLSTLMG